MPSQWTVIRAAALAPLALQLAVLVARSYGQYRHYNLSLDFSIFHQAWHQIAHGDLSPEISAFGYPYWRSHFELVMWLLAPLHWAYPHAVLLLWLQDTATVAAEAVAIWWAADLIEQRWRRDPVPAAAWARGVPIVAVGVLAAVNPWVFSASGQDFHLEALGVLFAILAARAVWAGRLQAAAVWVVLALITGDVSGTYVAGIGLSVVVADRRRWRLGVVLAGAGVGWIALATALHANRGSGVDTYSWLIDGGVRRGVFGVVALVAGIILHPSKAISVVSDRWHLILEQLVPVGTIGAAAPWVAGPVVFVLLENALNPNPFFIRPSYQNLPVYVFALTGTATMVDWLARRTPRQWRVGATLALTSVVGAVAVHLDLTRQEPLQFYRVDSATAHDLDRVSAQIPGDAEVIASFGIAGRFGDRRYLYLHARENQVMPVRADQVMFVFAPWAGNQPVPQDHLVAVAHHLRDALRVRTLLDGPSVFAYLWTPPANVGSVALSLTDD